MAIQFDEEKESVSENTGVLVEGTLTKKKKSAFLKWTNATFVLSVLAVIYAISYVISGFIALIPTLFFWIIWLCIVVVASIITIGTIWFSDGWNNFNNSFMSFNNGLSDLSLTIVEFLYLVFPYVSSFFALWIIAFLILSVVGLKRQKDKNNGYKAKLIWSIVLTIVFVGFTIFNLITYLKM